jgi:hypothetical protein
VTRLPGLRVREPLPHPPQVLGRLLGGPAPLRRLSPCASTPTAALRRLSPCASTPTAA